MAVRKKRGRPRKISEEVTHLIDRFPELETPGRVVYFDELKPIEVEFLKGRGYAPVLLFTLPRSTPSEEQAYLKGYAQGVLEGTITPPKNVATIVKTMFDEAGLLGNKDKKTDLPTKAKEDAIEDALAWGRSRFTMDNSTHGAAKVEPKENGE